MEARRGGVVGRGLQLLTVLGMFVTLVVGWLGAAPPARAAGTGLVVLQNTAQNRFPRDILFSLEAQSPDQISQVHLLYRLSDVPVTYSDRVEVAPGFRVAATFDLKLQRRYLPPGVIVHYRWVLNSESGASFGTTWSSMTVEDPRFAWKSRTSGPLTLHWYDGDSAFADAVLADARAAYARAIKNVGIPVAPPGQIYLYATENDFRGALALGTDQWVGGQTFPLYHVVILLAPSSRVADAQRDVSHEVSHLAIDGATANLAPLPTWLDEGIAMVAEGQPDSAYQGALASAVRSGHLISLQSLTGNFPEDSHQALIAYAESESLVRYFQRTYGQERLARLVDAFRHGQSADEAFRNSAGVSVEQFEKAWRQSIGVVPSTEPSGSPVVRVVSAPIDLLSRLIQGLVHEMSRGKLTTASP